MALLDRAVPVFYLVRYLVQVGEPMVRTIPVSEARQTLPELVSRMRKLMDRVIITRKGKPEAVIMGFEEYESWVETLELLSKPETVRGIREGLADLKAGRSRTFEEIFGEPLHAKPKRR
jgi:prevent-host-death family protein